MPGSENVSNTGGAPVPRKKGSHGPECQCARCKRITAFRAKKKIEYDEVIRKYLLDLPNDQVLLFLSDETIEAIKPKLPVLKEKFSFSPDFTREDYTRFLNELANTSMIEYVKTL